MEELLELLTEINPQIDYTNNKNLVDNKLIDSYDIISIIAEVQDKFDVIISANYILPENFNSIEAIYQLIQKLKED